MWSSGNSATNRPKIVAAAFVDSCWLTIDADERAQMILALALGHQARTDALDRGAENRIAAHQRRGARARNRQASANGTSSLYAAQTMRKPTLYAYVSGGTL